MTQFSDHDQSLVNFLKRNTPTPPPPSFDLEDRIMTAVEQACAKPLPVQTSPWFTVFRQRAFWLSTAIATSVTLTWMGYRAFLPTRMSLAEERELEEFLAENWTAATTANANPDWVIPQAVASE